MMKVSELILFTLFFSVLSGIGFTAGFYFFVGICQLLRRVIG